MTLYTSSDGGSSWVANSPDTTCTLDDNLVCTFQTNHMSSFTFLGQASTFYINNNANFTSTESVTLNANIPAANYARLSVNGTNYSARS